MLGQLDVLRAVDVDNTPYDTHATVKHQYGWVRNMHVFIWHILYL